MVSVPSHGGRREEDLVDTRTPIHEKSTVPLTTPMTPRRTQQTSQAEKSLEFYTPKDTPSKSPMIEKEKLTFSPKVVSTPKADHSKLEIPTYSSVVATPKMPPPAVPVTSKAVMKPIATPSRVVQKQPKNLLQAPLQEPIKVHPELRSHLQSGPKDVVPKDLSGPMKTRSGKRVQGNK